MLPPYSRPRLFAIKRLVSPATCCRLNSRGERIFNEECGCTSLKCSKAACKLSDVGHGLGESIAALVAFVAAVLPWLVLVVLPLD